MTKGQLGQLSRLGVFRGRTAVGLGMTRKQLGALVVAGVIAREYPDTYRMSALPRTSEQRLRAAVLWAGRGAAAAGRSAGELYRLEGVRAEIPEIVVPGAAPRTRDDVIVHRTTSTRALMIRRERGLPVTGVEPTIVALAHALASEALEIACEDARRRRLTSVDALRAYVATFGARGHRGLTALRGFLDQLDPVYPSRSTLEIKTRRLLVASGFTDFVREFPLESKGRTYYYDFAFERQRTILETNGRRWHDDPVDYERDNEKWSVPARHRFRIVFATWAKVTQTPASLVEELDAALGR